MILAKIVIGPSKRRSDIHHERRFVWPAGQAAWDRETDDRALGVGDPPPRQMIRRVVALTLAAATFAFCGWPSPASSTRRHFLSGGRSIVSSIWDGLGVPALIRILFPAVVTLIMNLFERIVAAVGGISRWLRSDGSLGRRPAGARPFWFSRFLGGTVIAGLFALPLVKLVAPAIALRGRRLRSEIQFKLFCLTAAC